MKKILLLTLVLLTACAAPSTPSASPADPPPASAILTVESTSGHIQRAMLESAARWTTLYMEGTITWHAPNGDIQTISEKTWLDPLSNRFRSQLTGVVNNSENTLKLSDGTTIFNINYATNQAEQTSYPDFARVGQYIPPLVEGTSYPNPIWGQLGTPLSEMAFSSNFAQGRGTFKPLAMESVAGRDALIVEWTYAENAQPSYKFWLDQETAAILGMQEFSKEGGGALSGERAVSAIVYDEAFDASLFVAPADLPQAAEPTQIGSQPIVTETGSGSALSEDKARNEDEAMGELYFFLQPHKAGESIRLARVSGVCVYDQAKCPPLETINVPFAFNFTINALSWSPDGKLAAFAYSDHPNGTPTKLWIFDPAANTWTSLAEFAFIDPPFWSPDGTRVAFRVQDGVGGEDVYVMNRDGSDLKSVSANLSAEGRPYIMDGWYTENIIMRSALPGANGSVYLVRASDGFARPMFDTLLTKALFIAAPDASLLAYDDYDYNSLAHELKAMEPDGANPVTLAYFNGGSLYPIVWSPNSKFIAFNYYNGFSAGEPRAEVYVVGRAGENLSRVYEGVTVGRLVFSPNGGYLLVEETTSPTGGHLFLVNLATLEKQILQAPGLSQDYDWYAPSWRP